MTYAAVSMAAVPMGIAQYVKAKQAQHAAAQVQRPEALPDGETSSDEANGVEPARGPQQAPLTAAKHPVKVGSPIGSLLFAGLASPFYDWWENGPTFGPLIGLSYYLLVFGPPGK